MPLKNEPCVDGTAFPIWAENAQTRNWNPHRKKIHRLLRKQPILAARFTEPENSSQKLKRTDSDRSIGDYRGKGSFRQHAFPFVGRKRKTADAEYRTL